MEIVSKSSEYIIYKKRNGRYAVKNAERKWINGEEKVRILLAEGLIRLDEPRSSAGEETAGPEDEPAEEGAAEEAGD